MTLSTRDKADATRDTGLAILTKAGFKFHRSENTHHKTYNIEGSFPNGKPFTAHVKAGSADGIRASTTGFGKYNLVRDDCELVFMAINVSSTDTVRSYLVPTDVVEHHADLIWKHRDAIGGENSAFSMDLYGNPQAPYADFANKFAKYFIGESPLVVNEMSQLEPSSSENEQEATTVRPLTVEQAKAGLAAKFDVPIDAIKISIEI